MKIKATFEIDCEVLKNFISVPDCKNSTPDAIVEKLICEYVEKIDENSIVEKNYSAYTEEFLKKCKDYKVGEFINIFLRKFLEEGVASEEEVGEMQKANGQKPCKKFKIPFGLYCNNNFKTSFPLLIDAEHRANDNGNNFWVRPSTIYEKEFYICSQWARQHRKPTEDWIRNHLPKWFEKATEDQQIEMKKFIEQYT